MWQGVSSARRSPLCRADAVVAATVRAQREIAPARQPEAFPEGQESRVTFGEHALEVTMLRTDPRSLDAAALSRRLSALAGDEREVQVEFLLHLDAFDGRRGWAEAGYPSLWEWCLRVLHLREGAAGRRIAAMRVLRRFPSLAAALRDGRLCLSTLALLGPVLTDENRDDLVARAAFLTRAEVERLVASLAPRPAPKEGLRLVSSGAARREPVVLAMSVGGGARRPPDIRAGDVPPSAAATSPAPAAETPAAAVEPAPVPRPPSPATVRPVSADTYSLRVTVDASFKQELDALKDLLAHTIPGGDLAAVLREAVRCAIEKHGKRKGAVEPSRTRKAAPRDQQGASASQARKRRDPVPAVVRREVWKRDGGRCTWQAADGRRCGSTWKLELDHIVPVALGGRSTVENLRVCCASHNRLHAEQIFGPAHMDLFRRGGPGRVDSLSLGEAHDS
jgi:5-methylcytosine-specific restriction endonuclease McrA